MSSWCVLRQCQAGAFGAHETYRTMVLRNQGLLAMEGTASSISGCILMKLSVSSGNSLDTLYLSMDAVPAQLPGLRMERRKSRREEVSSWRQKYNRRDKTPLWCRYWPFISVSSLPATSTRFCEGPVLNADHDNYEIPKRDYNVWSQAFL